MDRILTVVLEAYDGGVTSSTYINTYLPHGLDVLLFAKTQRYPLENEVQMVHERSTLIAKRTGQKLHSWSATLLCIGQKSRVADGFSEGMHLLTTKLNYPVTGCSGRSVWFKLCETCTSTCWPWTEPEQRGMLRRKVYTTRQSTTPQHTT